MTHDRPIPNTPEDIFPQRMREYRTDHKLSQQKIADTLGVHRATYSGYETGIREPSASFIRDFSKLSGWTPSYLLGLSNIKQPVDKQSEAISRYENTIEYTISALYELIAQLSGGE